MFLLCSNGGRAGAWGTCHFSRQSPRPARAPRHLPHGLALGFFCCVLYLTGRNRVERNCAPDWGGGSVEYHVALTLASERLGFQAPRAAFPPASDSALRSQEVTCPDETTLRLLREGALNGVSTGTRWTSRRSAVQDKGHSCSQTCRPLLGRKGPHDLGAEGFSAPMPESPPGRCFLTWL